MQDHSPFESGYTGNHDPHGAVAVLDVTFPRDRLLAAGASEDLVDRITVDFDDLDVDMRRRAIEAFEQATDEELVEALATAEEQYARQDAYDALPEEDREAIEALTDDEQAALAGLTEAERAALAGDAETADEPVPDGTVDAVLAWVGDDRARAARALDAEEQASEPRVTLVKPLQDLLAQPADAGQ